MSGGFEVYVYIEAASSARHIDQVTWPSGLGESITKAPVLGTGPQGREFKSRRHHCQIHILRGSHVGTALHGTASVLFLSLTDVHVMPYPSPRLRCLSPNQQTQSTGSRKRLADPSEMQHVRAVCAWPCHPSAQWGQTRVSYKSCFRPNTRADRVHADPEIRL